MLIETCRKHAERPAFECLGVQMSYADWDRGSRDFAAFLAEEVDCRPGDRIAIMLPNMLAYPVTFLGAPLLEVKCAKCVSDEVCIQCSEDGGLSMYKEQLQIF